MPRRITFVVIVLALAATLGLVWQTHAVSNPEHPPVLHMMSGQITMNNQSPGYRFLSFRPMGETEWQMGRGASKGLFCTIPVDPGTYQLRSTCGEPDCPGHEFTVKTVEDGESVSWTVTK